MSAKLKTICVGYTFTARSITIPRVLSLPIFPMSDFERQLRAIAEASTIDADGLDALRRQVEGVPLDPKPKSP